MSIVVVRAFVRLRGLVAARRQLAARLDELERNFGAHDAQIGALLHAIGEPMLPPGKPHGRIGFGADDT